MIRNSYLVRVVLLVIFLTLYVKFPFFWLVWGLGRRNFDFLFCSKERQTSADEFEQLKRHIYYPNDKPYNFNGIENKTMPNYDFKQERAMQDFVHKLLKEMNGGFFVEAGAVDGEYLSNTLNLEMKHKWKGLLVESNPKQFTTLLQKNRKVFATDLCLGNVAYPQIVEMSLGGPGSSKIISENDKKLGSFQATCFPIRDILRAINVNQIDYFSLDIEGQEMGVLRNFPWDEVQLKVLSIEVNKLDKTELRDLMTSKGFKFVRDWHGYFTDDHIYAHNSIYS